MEIVIYKLSEVIMWLAFLLFIASTATSKEKSSKKKLGNAAIILAITSVVIYLVIGTSRDIGDVQFILICNSATIINGVIEKRNP